MSWDDWQENMKLSITGEITIKNMQYDRNTRRVAESIFTRLEDEISRHWDEVNERFTTPESMLPKVVDGDLDFYLFQGKVCAPATHEVIRIMDADDFVARYLPIGHGILNEKGHVTEQEIDSIKLFGYQHFMSPTPPQMQTRRPYTWVTDLAEFHNAIKNNNNPDYQTPDLVRDLLGLLHFNEKPYLVGLIYPRIGDPFQEIIAPTFIEGCPSRVYRSRSTPDGWGRAVNLSDFTDGLKEGLHRAFPFSNLFKLEFIGRISVPVGAPEKVYRGFLDSFA